VSSGGQFTGIGTETETETINNKFDFDGPFVR